MNATALFCVTIDPEFKSLCPPLRADELETLERNLASEGCRDAVVTWDGLLLDGHNRYEICTRLGIEFAVREVTLTSREEAVSWIIDNQLGRRNLAPDQAAYLRGRKYNAEKTAGHGAGSAGKSCPQNTAERLAPALGVAPKTLKNDGVFAEAVDHIGAVSPETRDVILSGQGEATRAEIMALRDAPEEAILEAAADIRVRRSERRHTAVAELMAKSVPAAEGSYRVIVIDPPWPMQKIERDVRPNQVVMDYPVMEEDELALLNIPCADDAHVFVWTTHRFVPMALRLLGRWGLTYVCMFVWHKPGGFQPYGLPQYNCEVALYARRGSPTFVDTKAFPLCFAAPRGAHSEKPELFYETLRRVTEGPRLDMFNRRAIEGFDGWGNEAADTVARVPDTQSGPGSGARIPADPDRPSHGEGR